jgi:subtilase family serine protease
MVASWRVACGLILLASALAIGCSAPSAVSSASAGAAKPAADQPQAAVLSGNRPAFAVPERRIGAISPQFSMDRMILLLQPTNQQALDSLAAAQQDPGSLLYHQWLTPAQYAAEFGATPLELAEIASWLASQGFQVDQVAANGRMIFFSGTAAQVDAAFQAQMSEFLVNGETHVANAADPEIPAEFAGAIAAIAGLHDLRSAPQSMPEAALQSAPAHTPVGEFSAGWTNYLAPADVATIYDIAPLYQQGVEGSGTAIAVLARSNLLAADVADFRAAFALPANPPQVLVNGTDPGTGNEDDLEETELDAEWAGAIAPQATIDVVASASTQTTDGILLSAEYAVDANLAPVIAVSYGACEAELGSAENAVYNALWEQAAVEGIAVVVAAGDSGAAGCDEPTETVATHGPGVNGLCSTPYSLCVGGTEFTSQTAEYWATDNGASGGSALGYVPEAAWNESGIVSAGIDLWAGGGGASILYARPAWQAGTGNPTGAWREVPDVSLSSAGVNGYLIWLHGAQVADSGTSAAAQVLGGIAALLMSGRSERQGNLAPLLYAAAAADPAAFHDIVSGNNSVPGVAGFSAVVGYDEATGLGSIDAAELLSVWPSTRAVPSPCALPQSRFPRSCPPIRPVPRRLLAHPSPP